MYVFILLLKQGLKTYSTPGTVTVVGTIHSSTVLK